MMYSVPYINENLQSVDFLNNNVQKVQGKTPFFDDETPNMMVQPKKGGMPKVRTRPSIHLKDSWHVDFTTHEKDNTAIIKLTNSKKTADGKWVVADLLWFGTREYQIDAPTIKIDVPIVYRSVAEVATTRKGWKGVAEAFKRSGRSFKNQGQTVRQTVFEGHHTGAMSFYNRYAGKWFYNKTFRRGIRNALVTSFKEYILLCVENGIRKGIQEMLDEGILKTEITDIHVRIAR